MLVSIPSKNFNALLLIYIRYKMIHECAKTKHFFPLAAQALSGVFLAEQIRQQQLASELQNHLQSSSSLTAMQALLNMGKLNSNGNLSIESRGKQVIFSQKCDIFRLHSTKS